METMEHSSPIVRIFINPGSGLLRSGWRIAIFVLILSVFAAATVFAARTLVPGSELAMNIALAVALLAASAAASVLLDRRPFHDFGIAVRRRFFLEWGQGLLLAGVMMTFIVIVFMLTGSIEFQRLQITTGEIAGRAVNGLVLFTIAAFNEELMFRGYAFQTLARGTGRIVAVVVVSVFFGAVHLANPGISVFSFLNIVLAGIFLSLAYFRTETLWFCTALHIGWNYFQGTVYSLPVSGLNLHGITIFHSSLTGPAWLTGGPFGPEGGFCATVILLAGTAVVAFAPWLRNGNRPAAPSGPETGEAAA